MPPKAIDASCSGTTMKFPLVTLKLHDRIFCVSESFVKPSLCDLRLAPPSSGYPSVDAWTTTFVSMIGSGVDLAREPLDVSAAKQHSAASCAGTS